MRTAKEIAAEIAAAEMDDLEEIVKKVKNEVLDGAARLIEDAKCYPVCDSYGHHDLCPVACEGAAIRAHIDE